MSKLEPRLSGDPTTASVATAVIFYCLCSSSMLLVNKLAVFHIPSPALVTLCQFVSASVFVYMGKLAKLIEVDDFEWSKVKFFLIYVAMFSTGTFSSMKVLSMANVETVIVFRSCTPLAVCIFDYFFYQRALPGLRSTFSLLLIGFGAFCYMCAKCALLHHCCASALSAAHA